MIEKGFKLSDSFIDKYKRIKPPFGFNGLGEIVYMRTYSRLKGDGKKEKWYETVRRVVEGTYNMQKRWIEEHRLGWSAYKAQKSAQEMYERIFTMKFLPPGRGLWTMGSSIIEERGLYEALNNCSFVSTEDLKDDPIKPFIFLMDMSMLGVGVGFDANGAGSVVIKGINKNRPVEKYIIPDSREGWVESVRLILEAYFHGTGDIEFDYSIIRKEGEPIKGFGGVAPGYKPLKQLHDNIRNVMDKEVGAPISARTIVDIMNMIGVCVVSGNIRRSAEIVFGDYKSDEYLDLKNYKKNPDRKKYGWASNNSIFADLGMNYHDVVQRTVDNGEPGYIWLENIQGYSRMNNGKDYKDKRSKGSNPCSEQSLESYELCTLVETFPDKHDSLEDYIKTLKYAYLYAKTVTLGETHWVETNRVMLRNRRIGCSMSGIVQFIQHKGLHVLKEWCKKGYDAIQKYDETYSDWFAVPKSIKTTSVKPSGSVSLLNGSTPGVHFPIGKYYIRRITISKSSELIEPLKKAGYKIEDDVVDSNAVKVEFPISLGDNIRTASEVSAWEKVALASFMQRYWSDNQVSCTVEFKKEEANQIESILNYYQYQLKGISFLPSDNKTYEQMPYETIKKEDYEKMISNIKKINFGDINEDAIGEKYCDTDICIL